MANIAIKGHKTRGKEVIEILEMLGGNSAGYTGTFNNFYYWIEGGVITSSNSIPFNSIQFTLEEFLEKFPYKVGDKVCFPDDLSTPFTINKMWWDENANELLCSFIEDDIEVPVVGIRTYKEKSIDKTNKVIFETNVQSCDISNEIIKKDVEEIKIDIPNGYEFFGIDDDNKIVLTKIQSQYPKTYEECCKVLGIDIQFCMKYLPHGTFSYRDTLIYNLQELIICRNAYWKIAGEEMGLDKPWEPDWNDCTEDKYFSTKYIIQNYRGKINRGTVELTNHVLAFPTEEMRDAFYNNFKGLIEQCKELL